jgi:hypothetical protein
MSHYEKDFDIQPMVINFLNGDSIRVYINPEIKHSINYQMDMLETKALHFMHYTADAILDFMVREHERAIPFSQIRDVVLSDPEYATDEDESVLFDEIGMAVWSVDGDDCRIMVSAEDIGNF